MFTFIHLYIRSSDKTSRAGKKNKNLPSDNESFQFTASWLFKFMVSQTFNADFATLRSLLQEYLTASILEGGCTIRKFGAVRLLSCWGPTWDRNGNSGSEHV